ncbi:uncharacterized protein LOC110608389 [Manihot esculenta]|uniref:uncharacterized protein LOC110608389 n=1 Tax=Manihot esculenta TaxID=3983 RepID=UPI001CC7AA36|nr:uncharacterized protein LOC110608389 [Manihot esculenta]
MPFGLKNAGATYQRLMNKIFKEQIGRNIEVYVDDMVVKSSTFQQHLMDLREVFEVLERYRMRLNPAKCAFFIRGGKFLGYMVSGKGIEPNPEKVEAILKMPELTCVRDVQRITGRVVALNHFMSRSAERCLPFFKKLRKVPNFEWTKDCQEAFKELKCYLSSSHVLSSSLEGEELLIYLAASEQAVSDVLSHQGVVMTDQPLKKILHRPETSGRILAWSIEISPYCLEYQPRTTIKSQALADFITECSFNEKQAELGKTSSENIEGERERQPSREFNWKLYVDGASGAGGSGAGIMLKGPEGFKVCYALRLEFSATNNVAEYEALMNRMMIAAEVGAIDLEVNSDSQLVIGQVTGAYQAKDLTMQSYLAKVKAIEAELRGREIAIRYQRIPWEENEEADLLSRLSKEEVEHLPDEVYIQHVSAPAFDKGNAIMEVEEGRNWMTPYLDYLERGKLPEDKVEAKKIAARAANYQAMRRTLYRRGKSSPWLRCVSPEEAIRVMEEVHQGVCRAHEGAGTLANKIFRQGYYWPTVKKEAEDFVRRCDVYQRFANAINVPATPQSSISSPWPFSQFEIPRVFISDNGRQFDCKTFKEFTENMGIWHKFSSVAHPQTNGQTEVTNKAILQGLKKRLDGAKANWADELNSILWALRTTPRASTKATPCALAFGTEAVVPIELQVPTHRV